MSADAPNPALSLEALLRHLAECPAEFLAEPRIGAAGAVSVPAVVGDLLTALGGPPLTAGQTAPFQGTAAPRDRNRLRLTLVAAWLLHDEPLREAASATAALRFLADDVAALAPFAPAERWVQDPDRREELVRRCLARLGIRPAGETAAQAEDRLATLDSAGREQVIAAARAAEARARAVREAMARQAAHAASLKAMRE